MAKKDLEKLKRLSPRERIEKLKEIQEKDKKEIEKAQELIRESEEQADLEEQTKEIPIPQLKAVDIGALFSPEEKDLFKAKRFISERPSKEPEAEELPPEIKALEEVAAEAPRLTEEERSAQTEYLTSLSQRPAEELHERVRNIYNSVKTTGEITPRQQEELHNIEYAERRKMQDIEAGKYKEVTRQAAQDMVITERMKNWLQDSYGRG